MKRLILAVAISLQLPSTRSAGAECINPKDYRDSVVEIVRYNGYYNGYDGGSAWFYKNARMLVTAGHVANILLLSASWSKIEVRQRKDWYTISETQYARILRIGRIEGADLREIVFLEKFVKEDVAIVELSDDFRGAKPLDIAKEQESDYRPLFSVAYPAGKLVFASGHSLPSSLDNDYLGDYSYLLHINMRKPDLIRGASGAPILNCEGRVVGILTIKIEDAFAVPNPISLVPSYIIVRRGKSTASNFAVHASFVTELLQRK